MLTDQDLAEFREAMLTGITVGIGSIILIFSSGARIPLQCAFECIDGEAARSGHGEDELSSPALFEFLNHQVTDVEIGVDWVLSLYFDNGKYVKILPEKNGLESYVVATRHGICPVAVS